MNGYDLSRKWFDFCFENPEKVKPNHTALYFFCIEHCNRLGWKQHFGLPTTMAKEALGIHSYNTYINTLCDLVEFGFIELVQKSKNQYSSNIVALSNFDKALNKALNKALDKALIKHVTKQSESTVQSTGESIDSIIKQLTKNKELLTKKQRTELMSIASEADAPDARPYKKMLLSKIDPAAFDLNPDYFKITLGFQMLFHDNLKEAGSPTKIVDEAKGKWYDHISVMIDKDKITTDQLREMYLFIKSDSFWKKNIRSTEKLRFQKEALLLAIKEQKEKAGRAVSSQIQSVNWNVNHVDADF